MGAGPAAGRAEAGEGLANGLGGEGGGEGLAPHLTAENRAARTHLATVAKTEPPVEEMSEVEAKKFEAEQLAMLTERDAKIAELEGKSHTGGGFFSNIMGGKKKGKK